MAYKLPYSSQQWFGGQGQKHIPERNSVVIFKCPGRKGVFCVKRVIGLPGDRIEIHNKKLIINDKSAEYLSPKSSSEGLNEGSVMQEKVMDMSHDIIVTNDDRGAEFGPIIVPPDHIFVLGDHRDVSNDSRFWGPIPAGHLRAEALFVWMSLNWNDSAEDSAWPSVRWGRLFKPIH